MSQTILIRLVVRELNKSYLFSNEQSETINKLEPVFIKHYAPNSLPLTVNSHHVLFVKRLLFLCFLFVCFSPEIFKGP